ncbi:MAG TPA: hypothetical protein PLL36_08895, partial [Candidatus Hydrogenedentes bacterium]|nr:hypothetical protein [Candidatus Hydrogenedentota bacterium]
IPPSGSLFRHDTPSVSEDAFVCIEQVLGLHAREKNAFGIDFTTFSMAYCHHYGKPYRPFKASISIEGLAQGR